MRSFFLLVLSLMTGCEASSVKGCEGGWVEFTCKYPKTKEKYQSINVVHPKRRNIQSRKENMWENDGRVSLYHDTENKTLRVIIKSLQQQDFGEYRCKFDRDDKKVKKVEQRKKNSDDCQTFHQTAYRAAKTTITCRNKPDSRVKFLCKEKESTCEQILSTKSPPESNRKFTHDETSSDLSMSISDVSSQHDGVYWCGETSSDGTYRAGLRRIQLEVKDTITTFTRSPLIGQDFSAWCKYPNSASEKKFLCKGEDPSTCEPIVNTTKKNSGRFSLVDHSKTNITLTVRGVTTEDTGTYWCGAESHDKQHSNMFVTKFFLTVGSPKSSTTPVSSTSSTTESRTTTAAEINVTTAKRRAGGSALIITVIVCAVVLLLSVLALIFIYRRFSRPENTRTGAAAAQQVREDYVYEEIQERVKTTDSVNTTTIYATANFPTNPSASLHYSTINFQNSSNKAGGEAVICKPSSSSCEYSTVKPGSACSTVEQPSIRPEDHVYSTVNKPQRQ